MKQLVLVRHGKSSWEKDLPDEERPLKKRAYKDARLVTKAFQNFSDVPWKIWSSYANRALTTARLFQKELEVAEDDFFIKDTLYTFSAGDLLRTINSCDDSIDHLMVFGHNPAMTGVVNSLGDRSFDNIPTTGLSLIQFETDSWTNLKDGKTILYLFPKNLR
ncbi:SixA phosphatase family protein [Salinimicrobium flavum]|uniref:SixA phosphatase family protein n=1 Tax=Salinimicrobium flavum TaxID=1737065 RepID=A0ABW5J175_9FLAO